jgi:UDP-2-acetamido-3-amino-2,3-dideoxy-glucuronate N-acetyltransferase
MMAHVIKEKEPAVAVVGCGYWGKNLVRNFHGLKVLKLVCDRDETSLLKIKSQYNDIETCLAFSDVLSRDDIHAVVIATSAETHFNLAREAILANKDVFVEKPLALLETEGEELINLAKQNNRLLMVGHLLQYHPVFIKLKELVSSGELGRVNYIYSHRLNLGKIRREENILWSFAPHDISMILSLAGEMPDRVHCTGGNYLHQKIADVTTTHLEFPSGLKAHIFVSWLHPFKDQKLVVVGGLKMAVFDDTQSWEDKLLVYPHKINWQNNVPYPTKAEPDKILVREAEPLQKECSHFLDCIRDNRKPITCGEEGLSVLKVLSASQISLNDHGHKVKLEPSKANETHFNSDIPSIIEPSSSDHLSKKFFAHSSAVVDENVQVGPNTKIWHFCHILAGTHIGDNCNIGQNVVIGPNVTVGNRCKIQNNVSVYDGVTIEDGVFCGPAMVFTNVYNPRAEIPRMDQMRPTLVKKGTTIGANATIVCGTTLGRYSFIGAGAVVIQDVPDYALMVGNPAVRKGWICSCGIQLTFDDGEATCRDCQRRYRNVGPDKIIEIRC